ncbi:MAG: RICIN domain-containing protein, partial [Candidatus Fimimonas sp.]
ATRESFQSNQMTFEDRGNGYYSFRPATSDDSMAFEVGSDNRLHLVSYNGSDKQLFKINRVGLYNYTIACKANNNLISQSGEEYCVHLYPDCDSAQQRWYIVVWHE